MYHKINGDMGFPLKLFYHFKQCNMQKEKSQHLEFQHIYEFNHQYLTVFYQLGSYV